MDKTAQLTISVWTRPAPSRLKKDRTGGIVIPARGASQTGFSTSTPPTFAGKEPASKEISVLPSVHLIDQPQPFESKQGSTELIVLETGATASAWPPVAMALTSSPISSLILSTSESTIPAKP